MYSGGHLDSAKVSFLALFPYESVTIDGLTVSHKKEGDIHKIFVDNPWNGLETFFSNTTEYAFGFLSYEMGAFSDPDKWISVHSPKIPLAYWQRCAIVAKCDHQSNTTEVIFQQDAFQLLSPEEALWAEKLTDGAEWRRIAALPFVSNRNEKPLHMIEVVDRQPRYLDKIEIAQEYIRAGDIYQVNLSQQFTFEGERDPFDIFYRVYQMNPAPFSAYFHLDGFSLVSTSPERFLKRQGSALEARPIKGTIRRGKTAEEDVELKRQLLSSPKERAELLMITDLMRNDLGKISQVGSVQTDEIWRCESYTNVFHLLSVIRSQARPELSSLDIIRSCFPGGSITGCPKLRAMEVIAELEQRPRGIYTGSIGYIKGQDEFDLNIAIRTLLFTENTIQLQLGGGIVMDSIPESEYEETLIKGLTIFDCFNSNIVL